LFQRSSRHTTEIYVQYSTASLTVWLCRICLRHRGKILLHLRLLVSTNTEKMHVGQLYGKYCSIEYIFGTDLAFHEVADKFFLLNQIQVWSVC
jgi:hypothetical protein